MDWELRLEQTRSYLALDDVGAIWRSFADLQGDNCAGEGKREAVETLLNFAFEKLELPAPIDCLSMVLKRYSASKLAEIVMLIALKMLLQWRRCP